jgi:hypothetical protein
VNDQPPDGLDPLLETLSERLREWLDVNREDAPEEIEALWFDLRSMRLALADWGQAWRGDGEGGAGGAGLCVSREKGKRTQG